MRLQCRNKQKNNFVKRIEVFNLISENIYLKHYLPCINHLPDPNAINKDDLINSNFLIDKIGDLEMYYAPHNEYINSHAKIVIVGITPGWTQMKAAFRQAKVSLQEEDSLERLMISAKRAAGFAGTMRENLIEMLDQCGVNGAFQLSSSRELFSQNQNLLHTTSVIKYPVFVKEKNYTGYAPKIVQSSLLTKYAYQIFPKEIEKIKENYLLVPLGKAVTEVIEVLVKKGEIPEENCLFGFPHPSGANGHRNKQFQQVKSSLQHTVKRYSDLIN